MTSPLHVHEILIQASPAEVWTAITDPAWTRRYHRQTAIETSLQPGSGVRYVGDDGGAAVDGTIEQVDPERRLVMTWRSLRDATTEAEAPSRVEWSIEPANDAGSVTRVRVRHYDLGLSPATWAEAGPVWAEVLAGLKTVLETGRELDPVTPLAGAETGAEAGGGEAVAAEVERGWHRAQGVVANNTTWELLDGRELSDDEAVDLLGRAHAAAYHWRRAAGPDSINAARAAWLCSRAHAVLGDGTAALRLAETCGRLTDGAGDEAVDFDRVYAVEARARALACLGRLDEAGELRAAATTAAAAVPDEQDREILVADLEAPPWFGL